MGNMSAEQSHELCGEVRRLVTALAVGDPDGASGAIGRVADLGGAAGVYAALRSAVDAVRHSGILGEPEPGQAFTFQFVCLDAPDSLDVTVDDAPPQARWAARFLVAALNQDTDTTVALFATYCHGAEEHGEASPVEDGPALLLCDLVSPLLQRAVAGVQ